MDWTVSDLMLFGTDVDEFRLERNLKPEKSLDEIEKLCVDEKLPLFERAVLLADSNYDVQKAWVIDQLPVLLEINRQAVIEKILPKISEAFHGCNVELHRAGSTIYSVIAQEKKVDPSVFATYFLPAILSHFENKNPNIGKFWLTTLLSIIHYLPKEVLKHKMMTVVRLRGQLSQPVPSRQTCCKILSRMGSNLETNWVKQELLSLVKSLAQDVDNDVRETMCGELPLFAKSMGPEACSMFVLPEMVELSRDEEVGVRCAAMEAIVDLIPLLDEVSLEKIVVPLVMELLEEGETGKNMKLRVSSCKVIGHYAHDLKGYLSTDQSFQMLRLYERLSQTSSIIASESKILSPSLTDGHTSSSNASMASGDSFTPIIFNDDGAECRRLCAYNMPAMMLFADRLKETAKLIVIVKSMTNDKHEKVRRTLASGFHEVVSVLGERSNKITKDFATLLHDDNIEVLMAIVEHMPEVIEVLAVAHGLDPKTRQPGLTEIVPSLIHFEQLASKCRQWRLHSDLLENMASLTRCMTSEQLFYKFFPMCWRCVHRFGPSFSPRSLSTTYVLPVKHAALKTICSYIKYIRKVEQRREICTQFIMECAHHESHKQRLLFIYVCQIVLENFSRQFFKEQGFFSALLELAKDPSSNVRLKLCSLLSQLKTIILLPTDRDKQQMFESTISKLLMDKDSDTIAAVNCAVKEMAKINYRIQSMVPHSMLEEDLIDRERQEEENQLLRDEELERERDKEVLSAKLSAEFRRGLKGIGGHSPSTARSLASKKLAGPSSKKSSPGVPRKTSGMTLNSASSSHSNSSSPNSSRGGGGKATSGKTSVGACASKRTGGGSSPSLSAGSSSPGLVHKSRSREGVSSSASSKSSPGQSAKKSQLSHTTKAPQRGSSYN